MTTTPPATNYWMTFTAQEDRYREVLSVLLVYTADEKSARCEIPAFGIVTDTSGGEWQVQIRAIEAMNHEVARRYGSALRRGVQTQAMYSETRLLRLGDDPVFSAEHYAAEDATRASLGYPPIEFPALATLNAKYQAGALCGADA